MAHAARNVKINGGIMRFSRSKMYHKKAAFVKTKIDIAGVNVPETVNDEYFRRSKAKKVRHGEGEIFEQKKAAYVVSEQRKKDQVEVDRQLIGAIKKNPEKKLL